MLKNKRKKEKIERGYTKEERKKKRKKENGIPDQ
jgi:hypothetical protein